MLSYCFKQTSMNDKHNKSLTKMSTLIIISPRRSNIDDKRDNDFKVAIINKIK